jgi:hypothetical protein
VDFMSRVGQWDMLGNDTIGDCGPISVANSIRAAGAYGDGTSHRFTLPEVLDLYSRTSGYDPVSGANDNGVVLQELLSEVRKSGIGGFNVLAFAEVAVADLGEVKAAIDLFGHVLIGANLPVDASHQLDAGQPWTPTSGKNGIPGSWGGHAIYVGQYDADGLTCATWGQTQRMTWDWWRRFVGESWVLVPQGEWFNSAGVTPTGLDLHGLGEELARLTGSPNPFPGSPVPVAPAPMEPAPVDPATVVVADAVDVALWSPTVEAWANARHTGTNTKAAKAVALWAREKGLTHG